MSNRFSAQLKGLQEAQRAAIAAIRTIKGDGVYGLDNAVQEVTLKLTRYVMSITPVATGAWRASHRPSVQGLQGRVFMDPAAQNPRSHGRPAEYGAILENKRGGRYAVYQKTYDEVGALYVEQALERLKGALP